MPGCTQRTPRQRNANMATQREATDLAEFVKFNALGAAVFGAVARQGKNGNGDFAIFSPAGYRADSNAPFQRYQELAVGMTTDLASKVNENDTGRILLLVLVATKPTAKSPMKIFNVWELTPDDARALIAGKPMDKSWAVAPVVALSSVVAAGAVPDLF